MVVLNPRGAALKHLIRLQCYSGSNWPAGRICTAQFHTAWVVPSAGFSIPHNWKQHHSQLSPQHLHCGIATTSFCAVLCRLSIPSETGNRPQMYLSIEPSLSTRPGAAHAALLLLTVQLFLACCGVGKCQEKHAGPQPKGIKAPWGSTITQEWKASSLQTQTVFLEGFPKVRKQGSVLPTLILSWATLNGEIKVLRNSLMSLKLLRPMLHDPSTSRTISVIADVSH